MRIVPWLVAIGALLYVALCGALFVSQRSFIYLPQPPVVRDAATSFTLPVDGAKVVVNGRPHAGPKALIYFGGNGEDVVSARDAFASTFPDHALYLVDYRGYGGSTGHPTEESIQADAVALIDRVRREHSDIALIGRSLGTGVAIRLAARRPATRLVLVTPYDSIVELAAAQFPFVPVRWLLIDRYESFRYAPAIGIPTTLVMADRDEVIPRASTEQLLGRFQPGIASLQVIAGTGHDTISDKPQYLDILRAALH